MVFLLCTIFFVSGISALVFETLWFHQAGLAFGNSVWASSLVLAGFMCGLALGNALAAKRGDLVARPIKVYAGLELAIAVSGIGLVYLLPVLGPTLAPLFGSLFEHPWILNPLRLLLSFTLLLVPSTAMGMTLPLLSRSLTACDYSFGRVLGWLYGWNTLGAVAGAVLAEFFLLRSIGLHGSTWLAGGLNLTAATGALFVDHKFTKVNTPVDIVPDKVSWFSGRMRLAAAFLAGFTLLALEVVWFRFLALFVLNDTVSFAVMLSVVLAGIALGGLAAAHWLRLATEAHQYAAAVSFVAGLMCVITYAAFPFLVDPIRSGPAAEPVKVLLLSTFLIFPVSFLSGMFFTLLGAALRNECRTAASTAGALTFTNTVGAALGAVAGGFVFLPLLGMESSFFLAAIIYGGIGLLLVLKKPVSRRVAFPSALVLVAGLVLFPFGAMVRYHIPTVVRKWADPQHSRIVGVREGLTETIIYLEHRRLGKPYYYQMLTNGFSMAGTGVSARRYMKLYVYLPVAMNPDLKNALLISYGVGSTAKALVDTRSIETIDVVDISREILDMNDIVFPSPADQPLRDPRVRVHIEDGRYFLQTTGKRFDLITGEPPPPENAGIVNLYTREYFQLIHDRLDEGGIVTYWLPILSLTESSVLSIMRAFCDVFADASLWHGSQLNLMLVGTRDAAGPVSEEIFARQWQDPKVIPELRALGFEYPEQLGALFIGGVDYLKDLTRDHPPLVDAWPKRIEKRVGQPGVSAIPLFRKWMDVASASHHFQQSPLIQRLWPPRLRADTLDFFGFQQLINMHFITPRAQDWGFPAIHQFLTQSSLEAPVLWMLGSDADLQKMFTHARPPLSEEPFAQFHNGVGLIAQRDFEAALVPLSNAEAGPDMRLRITTMAVRIYVLCLLARLDEARALADELYAMIGSAGPLLGYWQFIQQEFGIQPGVRTGGN